MFGLTPMTLGSWDYYRHEVARGAEDYFLAPGEELGRWIGSGAAALGLAGSVEEGQLARLFDEGRHPVSGHALGIPYRHSAGRTVVTGYALSFSPPKSVSLMWGLGDREVSARVRAAHDAAMEGALSLLETHAAFSRRGRGGALQVDTEGYLGVAFTHRTSRSEDPQLHSHVLVANKVRGEDERWRSLDGRELFAFQKPAGMAYQAALRAELTNRLGVEWTPVDANGQAEVRGVPEELIEAFSQRRAQVEHRGHERIAALEARLGRALTSGERAEEYQRATYDTRPRKGEARTTADLLGQWRGEAEDRQLAPATWLPETLGRRQHVAQGLPEPDPTLALAVIAELAAFRSTWGRAEVLKALFPCLPVAPADAGAVLARAEETAASVLAHREAVTLGSTVAASAPEELRRRDGLPGTERHGARRHTTRATLSREAVVLDFAATGREAGVALVERSTLRNVSQTTGLSKDQEAALARLCLGGEALTCVVGPAGSGKTRLLRAAGRAWGAEGIAVRGLAVSAVAAGVLAEETGMPTETVAKFLHEHHLGTVSPAFALSRGEVLVVDEAAMASSADLAELTRIVEGVSGKLVLVGDHRQLGAVEAGGLFRLLVADTRAAELTGGHRFLDPWEREATKRLRAGDEEVLAAYDQRGRVQGGTQEEMVEAAFAAWGQAREEGRSIAVLAPDHHSVDALANRARAVRVAAGEVEAEGISTGRQVVGVGDEVVTTRNDRRLVTTTGAWVRNGDRWSVSGRDEGQLLVEHTGGRGRVVLPAPYVSEHVALAYAMTLHKAQGTTVDRAVVLVERSTSAEHLYVGMTRGRQDNRALVVCEATEPERMRSAMPEPLEVLKAILAHRSAELSATEALRDELGRSEDPAHHAWLLEDARWRIDQAAGPDRRAELEALRREAQALSIGQGIRRVAEAELAAAQRALADVEASRGKAEDDLVEVSRPGFLRRPRRDEIKGVEHRIECLDREHRRCSERLVVAEERAERARDAEARSEEAVERLPGVEAAVARRQAWLAEHEPARQWHESLRSALGGEGLAADGEDFGTGGPVDQTTREFEDFLGPLLAPQGNDLEAGMDFGR